MEVPIIGKGLGGALSYLRFQGILKQTYWCGRRADMKKSILEAAAPIHNDNDDDDVKEIRIDRTDEYGRILTPKEAFRRFSHQFHGKKPGFKKRQKRIREYHSQIKEMMMKPNDTPFNSAERMSISQHKLQTPHLLLSGNYVI